MICLRRIRKLIFSKFLSDSLKQIGVDNIPESYKEISQKNFI